MQDNSKDLIHAKGLGLKLIAKGVLMPEFDRYSLVGASNSPSPKINKKDRRTGLKMVDKLGVIKETKSMSTLMKKMKSLVPLLYRKHYNFHQEWEKGVQMQDNPKNQQDRYIFSECSTAILILEIILTLVNIVAFWFHSIQFAFDIKIYGPHTSTFFFFVATLINLLKDLNKKIVVDNKIIYKRQQILKFYIKNQMHQDIISFIAIIVSLSIQNQTVIKIVEAAISAISFLNFKRKYSHCIRDRLINDQSIEKVMNLFQLFVLMIISSHFFGLCLYCAGNIQQVQKSWIFSIGINEEDWLTKYLYSIYWATTILVTVGFGDITPRNKYQVMVTMTVEFLGVALFGYVINTIGMTMSEIKKSSDKLFQQLKTVERLSNCFGLTPDLNFQMKQYIRNSSKSQQTFSIEQEKQIASKLSLHLNIRILHETNIRVIKKSVFFISNFTKNFQDQIALKLKKRLFQPEQPVGPNPRSLYIIDEGKLEVFYRRPHSQKNYAKLIKVITASKEVPLGYNIYGHTALFTNSDTNFNAISKTTTRAYELEKNDFMQLLLKNPRDQEAFFQLRDKLVVLPIMESNQGPFLIDGTYHYVPSHYLVIRKHLFSPKQSRRLKQRHYYERRTKSLVQIQNLRAMLKRSLQLYRTAGSLKVSASLMDELLSTKQQLGNQQHTPNNHIEIEFAEVMKQYDRYKITNNFSYAINKYRKFLRFKELEQHQNNANFLDIYFP